VSAVAFWDVLTFGLEALLFVLLGLQVPAVAEQLDVDLDEARIRG
jgi:NhaP-type Na+/H+ or K+/H+ antiporter